MRPTSPEPQPGRRAAPRRRFPLFTLITLAVLALLGYGLYRMYRPVAEPVRMLFGPRPQPWLGTAQPAPLVDFAASAPATARRKPGPEEVELCGVGVYKLRDLMAGRVHPDGLPDLRESGQALTRELAGRPEPQARAAALLLQTTAPLWTGMHEELAATRSGACELPDIPGVSTSKPASAGNTANDLACRAEREQQAQLWQAEAFAATQPLTQLVGMAQQGGDPALLALANDLCNWPTYKGVAACKTDLLTQWARLEPDNAQPWLLLMGRAQAAKDAGAQYEALYRASQAKYQRGYTGAVMPWLLRDVPQAQGNAADLVRDQLASRLTMLQFGTQAFSGTLAGTCNPASMQDGNRRQLCATLADTLSRNTDSAMGALIAARVGQQAGWSDARYQAVAQPLRDTLAAAIALQMRTPQADEISGQSCEAVVAHGTWLRALGRQGELQAMREAVAGSGKTVAELKAEYSDNMAKAVAGLQARKASAAASGLLPP